MPQFLPFFIILFAALFFSELFYRLHLPWVIALVIAGIIIGPFALDIFEPSGTVEVLGEIGLIFLMFMAGLETKLSTLKEQGKDVSKMAMLNGLIPFAVAVGLGLYFDFSLTGSILLGIIFISSSIAVVIPSLESHNMLHTRFGKNIVAATVIEDVLSLILLSIFLQTQNPVTQLPLPLFYILLFIGLFILRWLIPRIETFVIRHSPKESGIFQWDLQLTFVILLGTVIIFEFLGLHPIIAGFFAGLILSETVRSDVFKSKLRAISYGFFIPIFFVLVGTKTDLSVFFSVQGALVFTVAIVGASILTKFVSGWMAGRVDGFNNAQSLFIGASTIPQLSTTLAAVTIIYNLGLVKQELVTAMVILSIVTTFVGPLLLRLIKYKYSDEVLLESQTS